MKRIFFLLFLLGGILLHAQPAGTDRFTTNQPGSRYRFSDIVVLPHTPVKSQDRTGTCWSYSTLSFMESELLRKGKGEHDLAEMWVARHVYMGKAINYLRMDGKANFAQGGEFHDIPWVMRHYGLVPQAAYPGLNYGDTIHIHNELEAVLKAMVDALNKHPQKGHLTTAWKRAVKGTLDAYLGEVPDDVTQFRFKENGKTYNPKSFLKAMDLHPDDYVEITSFSHHPYYRPFVVEIPDNWQMAAAFNVPMDDMVRTVEYALEHGYTVAWGADVSEKGFSHRNGLAIVPQDPRTVSDRKAKDLYLQIDGQKVPNGFMQPVPEKQITAEMRQAAFDDKRTTDDHGMHIIGMARDQNGKRYFIVKNSWGNSNALGGYFFVSEPYFRYKTIMIFLHKKAVPKDIRQKDKCFFGK